MFAGLTLSWAEPAGAGICSGHNAAKENCRSATSILRKLLFRRGGENPREAVNPQPSIQKPSVQKPLEIKPPEQPAPIEQSSASVIYVPFPTPRPRHNTGNLSPAVPVPPTSNIEISGIILPRARPNIDPTTTAGIFNRCLNINKITEPDIRSQHRILKKRKYCITEKKFTENGLNWRIFVIQNKKKKSGPLFVVPHDNENSAFAAGVYALSQYGGSLVAVEAGERRRFKGQDPNRNFGTSRATANRCRLQRAPAPKYTRTILKPRKRGQPIIALHSNANGFSGNGGSGNISIKRKGDAIPFVSAIARSRRLKDEDTLIIVASKKPPSKDRKLARKVKYFTQKAGVNVLYEHVTAAKNDCSLSHYVALKGLGTYFNIEVENRDVKTQKHIVDVVMKSLR